jgi:hypothetical protein
MSTLVTLNQAKQNLRVTWNDEDSFIQLLLDAAEVAVLDYIKRDWNWTAVTVPKGVILAILVLTNTYYEAYRDGDDFDNNSVALGYPPPAVSWLLHRYRSPAYA